MARVFSGSIVTAIDIGTTKICVLIARKQGPTDFEILGIGRTPSHGLEKGVVVDIEQTVASIQKAVAEAELMADMKIEEAYIGISGSHIQSRNSTGAVPIKRGEIKQVDVDGVLASARAVPLEKGQQVLHVLPQYFVIDGKERVKNPVGLHGVRLEAQVHIITGGVASIQNIVKACEQSGIKVKDIVLEQLASADGVLSYDERMLGIGVLDIGGGTADFAVYQQGSIHYTKVFSVAGNHFTHDLAVGLRSTLQDAERIKREHGYVGTVSKSEYEVAMEQVRGHDHMMVSSAFINYVLQVRASELLLMLDHEIAKSNLKGYMTAGLVVTGGGSLLQGIDDLAQNVLSLPVRVGAPTTESVLPQSLNSPIYATGYGLLQYACNMQHAQAMHTLSGPLAKRIFTRMKSWVADFF